MATLLETTNDDSDWWVCMAMGGFEDEVRPEWIYLDFIHALHVASRGMKEPEDMATRVRQIARMLESDAMIAFFKQLCQHFAKLKTDPEKIALGMRQRCDASEDSIGAFCEISTSLCRLVLKLQPDIVKMIEARQRTFQEVADRVNGVHVQKPPEGKDLPKDGKDLPREGRPRRESGEDHGVEKKDRKTDEGRDERGKQNNKGKKSKDRWKNGADPSAAAQRQTDI